MNNTWDDYMRSEGYKLYDEVLKEPMVQSFLKVFKGDLLTVRSLDTAKSHPGHETSNRPDEQK